MSLRISASLTDSTLACELKTSLSQTELKLVLLSISMTTIGFGDIVPDLQKGKSVN